MTDLGLFRGRRLRPEELVDVVRKRAGVELLAGFERLVEARGAVSYQGEVPIASGSHLAEAHLIRQQPGAELTWETARVGHDLGGRDVVFVFPMAMGNGSPLPQPSGQFDLHLNGRRILGFTLSKDSQRWSGAGCCLYFDVRLGRATAFGASLTLDEQLRDEAVFVDGMALLSVAPELLAPGQPARLRVVPVQRQRSRRWFRLGRPLHPFLTDHLEPGLSALLTRRRPPRVGDYQLLFGDLHAHSAESLLRDDDGCGEGSREELFTFARDVAGLDVFCLSEHDWQMNEQDWKDLTETSDRFDAPGSFVTLPGYEWTSPSYGHRNVYLRDSGAAMFPSTGPGVPVNSIAEGAPTPADLWRHLDEQGVEAITVPHHMSVAMFPLSLEHFHHRGYDRVAEIYSCWGDSLEHHRPVSTYAERVPELAFIHALRSGHRVGFLASSDAHDGYPGVAQGKASHPHLFHDLGSGRVAVLADGHDRQAVFDAIRARRCYALTGPRIIVDMSLEGHPMGSEVDAAQLPSSPQLRLDLATEAMLDRVDIYRDGWRVDTIVLSGRRQQLTWTDPRPLPDRDVSYFAKVTRVDQECAWTSPIWVNRPTRRPAATSAATPSQ
ncbi:MAG TPA: CehA/McbA family metallohydrolase [Actinomycetes bacterium]|jgi:hypothetical protein|nr:CehA/McbA family metallohydrolase [Actinomycetes bacterium]